MKINILISLLLLVFFSETFSQCPGNLIKNGGFELDTIGTNTTGMFWEKLEGITLIDDSSDSTTPTGGMYSFGTPQTSSDGGNWQGFDLRIIPTSNPDTIVTRIGQNITLQKSVPHVLSFEFTALGFSSVQARYNFCALDVLINGELIHTTKTDTTLYTWEKETISFTPKTKDVFIEFRINNEIIPFLYLFAALDGVCLRPVGMGMFCEFE